MCHNIGEQFSNKNTDLENHLPGKITNQTEPITCFTIDLVKKYLNDYRLNIIPTKEESKVPAGPWKQFQSRMLSKEEINSKFRNIDNDEVRVAVICGEISGGLEVIDFDNKFGNSADIYKKFIELPGIKQMVDRCPVERSQSGGFHIYYRCLKVSGNLKLASWLKGKNEKGKDEYETLIETRGEGGYCILAPSKGYELTQGTFSNIPIITASEREMILSAARSFNQDFGKPKVFFKEKDNDKSPWILYDNTSEALTESKKLLAEHGWKYLYNNEEIRKELLPINTPNKTSPSNKTPAFPHIWFT